MPRGTVSQFNERGNYGFITVDEPDDTDAEGSDEHEDKDEDVFFHMADVGGGDLDEGQPVAFEIEQAEKGPRASNLTRLDENGDPVEAEPEGSRDDEDVRVDEEGNEWVSIHDM